MEKCSRGTFGPNKIPPKNKLIGKSSFAVKKKETLDYHILDIFNLSEIKYEEFVRIMCELNYLVLQEESKEDKNES